MRATAFNSISELCEEPGIGSQDQKSTPLSTTHGAHSLSEEDVPSGQIYFLLCRPEGSLGRVKIGWTRSLRNRIRAVETSSPYPIELIVSVPGNSNHEKKLHWLFSGLRSHGEWFDAADNLLDFISSVKLEGRLPFDAPDRRLLYNGEADPSRKQLARLVRLLAAPSVGGERSTTQIRRVASMLALTDNQVWRMWHGRGAPKFLQHVQMIARQRGLA